MDPKNVARHIEQPASSTPFPTSTALLPHLAHWPPPSRRDSQRAREGIEREQAATFIHGCRSYPKAMAWSLILSCTIIMEAYDKILISSLFASPMFKRNFGDPVRAISTNTTYQVSTTWQASLNNAAVGAEILGLFLNGYMTDRLGYRKTMLAALTFMCLAIFVAVFAINLPMLLASQLLLGFPWGIFQTLSATYAAEVLPVALRPYLLSSINMCWVIGQLTGVGVVHSLLNYASTWSYRIPLALQWAWAVPVLVTVLFAPEGPWWLIRHGRVDDARHALTRLTNPRRRQLDLDQVITVMSYTDSVERRLNQAGSAYIDCVRGSNLRRTEIACMVWVTQALCGATLIGFAPYFYEQAGFNTSKSFDLSTGMFGLALIGGMASWVLLRRFGRRTIYLAGLAMLTCILVTGGVVSVVLADRSGLNWILGSLVISLVFVYSATIGPVCYVLVPEIPSTRLRVKTVVLARVSYNLVTIVNNVLTPLMLNPTAWNWRGRSCWWFAGTAFLCAVWCFFRLPETKGLSYVELDILFDRRASTSKFKQFRVNLEVRGYLSLDRIERSTRIWHGWLGYS